MIILLLIPAWAVAQSSDEDQGFITNFLQDNLSDAGRTITINGFSGALSSRAQLDRLTIADDTGVWFIIEDVVLDWNRLALLRGNLDINELTAGSIELLRIPDTGDELPSPEATVFKLPELPISIDITSIKADRILLDAPVLGETVVAKLSGSLQLENAEGSVDISLERIESNKAGALTLQSSYANETNILDIDLTLNEAKDGILSDMLGLPGTPSLEFELSGHDPLTDFNATISLGTDGTPRFAGTVEIKEDAETEGTTFFNADLGGDISPLFQQEYQPFFGTDTTLSLEGSQQTDGRLVIKDLSLNTAAFNIKGSLALSSDRLPEQFDITGTLQSADDIVALIPLGGEPLALESADIIAHFLASENNEWSLETKFSTLSKGDIHISSGLLSATGIIDNVESDQRRVTADINASLLGLSSDDAALAQAMGSQATASTQVNWQDGAPVEITNLKVSAGGIDISGNAELAGADKNMRVTGELSVIADTLDRFAQLFDMQIGGQADVGVAGWFEPLGGAFDATVSGRSTDLMAGPDPMPALLKGEGTLDIAVLRDLEGVTLKNLDVQTSALSISASGKLQTSASDLKFDAKVTNIADLATGFNGPAHLSGTITQSGTPWTVSADITGPLNSTLSLDGTVETDPSNADLAIKGSFPIGIANKFLPANILINGDGKIDLRLQGPLDPASLSGQISTSGASVSMPTFNVSLSDLSVSANVSGSSATIKADTKVTQGGRISSTGTISLKPPFASNINIDLKNLAYAMPPTFKTKLDGQLSLNGPLQARAALSGSINLQETELYLASTGGGGQVPDIRHIGESSAVLLTRERAGFDDPETASSGTSKSGLNLDVTIHAPDRIFLRGAGLNAEMRGELRVTGTTSDIVPVGQFNLVRGHLDLFGRRLDLVEGQLFLQGSFDPFFRVAAQTRTNNATVRVVIQGNPDSPDITFESDPDMPEEEILAELLFGKRLSEMSPFEAASLASKIAAFANGSGNFSEGIREKLGLDSFGVTTSDDGNVALRAGKYVSENVYADIVVDSEGHSRVDLNLDLTSEFTARGSTDNQGNTGIGIFFERDY